METWKWVSHACARVTNFTAHSKKIKTNGGQWFLLLAEREHDINLLCFCLETVSLQIAKILISYLLHNNNNSRKNIKTVRGHLQAFLFPSRHSGAACFMLMSYFVLINVLHPIRQMRGRPGHRPALAATHTSQTLHNDSSLIGHLIRNGGAQFSTECVAAVFFCHTLVCLLMSDSLACDRRCVSVTNLRDTNPVHWLNIMQNESTVLFSL